MFGGKKNNYQASKVVSIVGKGMEISGNLTFNQGILIEGRVNGDIRSLDESDVDSLVVLHSNGYIKGDIYASNVILDGEINGNVFCRNYAEINQSCVVNGDLHYHVIVTNAGCCINGKLTHWEDNSRLLEHIPDSKARIRRVK